MDGDDRGAAGFLPGKHAIDGYAGGGFQFAGMSHRGSILALPSGIYAWPIRSFDELVLPAFKRVLDEIDGIDHLLIGTGEQMRPIPEIVSALRARGPIAEPMATAAAARTYSILLGEKRRVGAALIAVGRVD